MNAAEIAALCGAIVGVAAVVGLCWKAAKATYRLARRIELIEERSEQLVANSGSSMYDRLNQVHRTVHENSDRLGAVEEHQIEQDKNIAKNQGRIEAIALVTSPTVLVDDEGRASESRREGTHG